MISDASRTEPQAWLKAPLVQAFEAGTIDPVTFRHRQHLYVAWCYLHSMPLEGAVARYVHHLRQLTAALGAPQKFHATMTWAYLVLLHEAIQKRPHATFDELMTTHPELLDHAAGALYAHYDREQLSSPEARQRFVLPRRA